MFIDQLMVFSYILKVLRVFCVFLLLSSTVLDLCALPASVLTHQVHPGCSVAQRHADPGGRVSDDLMTHVTLNISVFFCTNSGLLSVRPSGAFFSFPVFLVYLPTPDDELDSLGLWFRLPGRRLQCHGDPTVGPRPDQAGYFLQISKGQNWQNAVRLCLVVLCPFLNHWSGRSNQKVSSITKCIFSWIFENIF